MVCLGVLFDLATVALDCHAQVARDPSATSSEAAYLAQRLHEGRQSYLAGYAQRLRERYPRP